MDVNDDNASVGGGLGDGNVEEGGAVHNEQIAAVAGGGVELPPLMNVEEPMPEPASEPTSQPAVGGDGDVAMMGEPEDEEEEIIITDQVCKELVVAMCQFVMFF